MYKRWQETVLQEALQSRRVILLTGPRQCGKTTLAKTQLGDNNIYRTLDDQNLLQTAQLDPHGFVKHEGQRMIIDEVQLAPALLSAIKKVVDEDTRPGQYLLTGSANIQSLPSVKESLAGRVRKIRLRPFTQGELTEKKPTFLEKAFKQEFPSEIVDTDDREAILKRAFNGGFPEVLTLREAERRQWYNDYIEALLDRDLSELINIRRRDAMVELLRVLAAWSSKFMDISAIGSGLGIQRATLESYINALEALYLVERLSPWTRTDYERVGKQPKLFMADGGLMRSILGWQFEQICLDSDRSGKLLETFIFHELSAQVDVSEGLYSLFHYRDREKREIDFLLEREGGGLIGIEVKTGTTIGESAFKHLKWFKTHLAKEQSFIGVVLYTGKTTISLGEGMWAVPLSMLWR